MDAIPGAELAVYEFVKNGTLRIDESGRIWRGSRRAENHRGRGYLQVRLMVNGHRYHVSAHRLVWLHVTGNQIPADLEINHRNGIKDDNRPVNLEVVSASDNLRHAHRVGLADQRGQKNPASKLSDNEVAAIRISYARGDFTQAALAKKYGVSFQCISKVVRGARRASNLGPTADYTLRRKFLLERDDKGRIVGKKADGREHNEYPGAVIA